MTFFILGIPFHQVTLEQTLERFDRACKKKEPLFCVTPNPEICLLAKHHRDVKNVLQHATLSIPDGHGILWTHAYLSGKRNWWRWLWTLLNPHLWLKKRSGQPERVSGTDVMEAFCLSSPKRKIFLLGAEPKVNETLAKKFQDMGVTIVGHISGDDSKEKEHFLRTKINESEAEVLFVAFGAPKQELWIARNLGHLPNVMVAMGVGGAFDFLSGKIPRAPKTLRNLGLEWLYRLWKEPKRFRRIINATVVFPWLVYRSS